MKRRTIRDLLALVLGAYLLLGAFSVASALSPSGQDRVWGYQYHPWLRYSSRWDLPPRHGFDDDCGWSQYPNMGDDWWGFGIDDGSSPAYEPTAQTSASNFDAAPLSLFARNNDAQFQYQGAATWSGD